MVGAEGIVVDSSLGKAVLVILLACLLTGCGTPAFPPAVTPPEDVRTMRLLEEHDIPDPVILKAHDWSLTPTPEAADAWFRGRILLVEAAFHDIAAGSDPNRVLMATDGPDRMYAEFEAATALVEDLRESSGHSLLLLRIIRVDRRVVSLNLCGDQQIGMDPESGLKPSIVFVGEQVGLSLPGAVQSGAAER